MQQNRFFFFNFEVNNVPIEFVNMENVEVIRIVLRRRLTKSIIRSWLKKDKTHNLGNKSRNLYSVVAERLIHVKRSRKGVDSREFGTDDRQPLKENNIVWYLPTRVIRYLSMARVGHKEGPQDRFLCARCVPTAH